MNNDTPSPGAHPIGLGSRAAAPVESLAGGGPIRKFREVRRFTKITLEQYRRYHAVATLAFSKGLIPEATLPALIDFLLAEFGKAVTEHICEVVEDFYAFAEEVLGKEEDE